MLYTLPNAHQLFAVEAANCMNVRGSAICHVPTILGHFHVVLLSDGDFLQRSIN